MHAPARYPSDGYACTSFSPVRRSVEPPPNNNARDHAIVGGCWHAVWHEGTAPTTFDDFDRTDTAPSTHQESGFEFLNRIAGDYWEHPRALMREWLDRMPIEQEYDDLRQRFRSRDDEQFRSAFLEVYLHESLIRAGYTVTIHPEVQGTSRRPDFLAERDDLRFFIEPSRQARLQPEKERRSAEPYCSTR